MRPALLTLLICALWLPRSARAWTDAHVRDVVARVKLSGDKADVTLDLGLDVRGGWLERLDLSGFEDGLEPAEESPAVAVAASGERVEARVVARSGVLSLHFQRRDGLRRGVHHLFVHYTAPLQQVQDPGSGLGRVYWTLPGWEASLHSAVIEVVAPGAKPVEDAEIAQDISTSGAAGETVARFSRLLVPRASPWTVTVEVPARAPTPPGSGAPRSADRSARLLFSGWALAGLHVSLLGLRRRELRVRRPARAFWLTGWPLTLCLALGALSGALWSWSPPAAILFWTLSAAAGVAQRPAPAQGMPFGRFVALEAKALGALQRALWRERIGTPWGDIGSVAGAVTALTALSGLVFAHEAWTGRDPWALGVLPALFGSIQVSRRWAPRSEAAQVSLLKRAARRARLLGCALELRAYQVGEHWLKPRLKLTPSARYAGLLRLEVLVDPRRGVEPLWLSAVVELGSPAERWLTELWREAGCQRVESGPRAALMVPVVDIGRATEQLLERLGRESQQRIAAAPQRAQAA